MQEHFPGLVAVVGLLSLTIGYAAEEADKDPKTSPRTNYRREIVNVAKGRPSHLILKTMAAFTAEKAMVKTATFTKKNGTTVVRTSSFDGVVKRVETASGNLVVIRLNCTTDPPAILKKAGRDSTTTGELSVTLSQTGLCDETITIDTVIADNDPGACP